MEFRVLGSIEAVKDGRRLAVASGRQLALLALLLVRANHVVSADRIIDELWGERPPETGAKAVAFHVSRLRDALEPGRTHGLAHGAVATEAGGYVLRVDPQQIDAVRFEQLILEGHGLLADDPETARGRLDAALALWRGEPYADVEDEPFARAEIERLKELRELAREDRIAAQLALGRHTDVIDELEALVAEQPLRERVRGQLMLALYRAGRQAEALRTYGDVRQALADELGIDPGPELQLLETRILRQDPGLDPPTSGRPARNPYKGLRPFEERDSADFFGREALIARLVDRVGQVARADRFLAVVGPSGSGKSSTVRAGLVAALRAGALPGSDRWAIAVMLPGAHPFRELTAALRTAGLHIPARPDDPPGHAGPRTAHLARLAAGDAPTLLVIDQLEELYSLVDDEAERSRFVSELVEALADPTGNLIVVTTLRADRVADALLAAGLGELLRTGTELVTPLTRDELERAIVRPAESVGVHVEPGLAAELIAEVDRQPGELPLLQYALTELFERSDGRRLTREGYAAIGGVLGALGRRADEVYAGLDVATRELGRQVFLGLVAPGESGDPIARRVPRSELLALSDDHRRVDTVIDAFGRRRLLAFDRDAATGAATVQVAHEALLGRWPRLAGWIDEARQDLWTRRRLADAAAEWLAAGRDPGFLLSGNRLDMFASWSATTNVRVDLPGRELVEASLAERHRQDDVAAGRLARERALERRATTRLRALAAVLAVAVVLASSLTLAVYNQGETAREQGAIALARELAAGSIGNLGTDPTLSLLLAWQAADATADRGYVVEEAVDALEWSLQVAHVTFPNGDGSFAIRSGPGGMRGETLLPPDRLMALAAATAGRTLTTAECRTHLHRSSCPVMRRTEPERGLEVYTAAGVVPVARLAGPSLAGTRVVAISQLPIDPEPLLAGMESSTGIDVSWTTLTDADLEARISLGDLPDMAIVDRPALVAKLAKDGRLVELSEVLDVAELRSSAGDYLVGLGTLGDDGSWPATSGRLYGAAFAAEDESLIWYPRVAFESAGYAIPATWADLADLAQQMVADHRAPWCLGLAAGQRAPIAAGRGAANFVEDLVLHTSGPELYDRWSTGEIPFTDDVVAKAAVKLGELAFRDGVVGGGLDSALVTPADLAAWPMFVTPPGCWLHLSGATNRSSWPAGSSTTLAAFPFPAVDPQLQDLLRGRVETVVVFHDRPEVRRLVEELLGPGFAVSGGSQLEAAGIWPIGSRTDAPSVGANATVDGRLLQAALESGRFRVSTSDLLPSAVSAAFAREMATYLASGQMTPTAMLNAIDASRWVTR